jgi:hypothetical protein
VEGQRGHLTFFFLKTIGANISKFFSLPFLSPFLPLLCQGPTKRVPPVVPISSASVTPPRSYILVGGLLFLPASQAKVVAHQARYAGKGGGMEQGRWDKPGPLDAEGGV